MYNVLLQAKGLFSDPIVLLLWGGFLAVFYFFFIRPQTKKAKDQKNYIEQLQKGDKVVTTGGFHGRILKVEDTYFMVEFDANTKIKVDKSGISMELSKAANDSKVVAEAK
jgi:preprotein translocase subunit YajC